MAIKPILFNTEMVRAILDGRKDATRRIVKGFIPDDAVWGYTAFTPKGYISCRGTFADWYGEKFFKLPCEPGDTIYVRETWCDDRQFTREATPGRYFYKASEEDGFTVKWHPSIHMPKEAARIWLKVTNVRVERLQDITSEQICKEGVEVEEPYVLNGEEKRYAFSSLWNSTIKKSDLDRYGWDANPWVWVIKFERCEKPEGV
jgi:hypothetical protein|nr:MAG TPA: ASCH domain protein [Caudoviricetes sp.]